MKRALAAAAAILALGATLIAGASSPTAAQDSTVAVYAVHGIPQSLFDVLGAPTTDVDVYAVPTGAGGLDTAEPALTFAFGDTAGPLDVPAGAYDVFVYPAGATPAADGSDAVLDLTTPDLPAGASAVIVAQLNEAGDGGALTPFVLDTSPTAAGQARVQAFHTAAAPEVDVELDDGTSAVPRSRERRDRPDCRHPGSRRGAGRHLRAAGRHPRRQPRGARWATSTSPPDPPTSPSPWVAWPTRASQVVPLVVAVGEDAAAPTPRPLRPPRSSAAPHFTG